MIEAIVRSQPPNKVLWGTPLPPPPPPVDPAEQLMPRFFRTVLSHLFYGNCSKLKSYRHYSHCPTCHDSTPPTTLGSSLHLPHTSNGPGSWGYVGSTTLGRSNSGGPPAVRRSASTPDRLRFLAIFIFTPAGVPLLFKAPLE